MSDCDLRIYRTIDNGLELDSYAAMEQIQPILRSAVIQRKGSLSQDDWENLLRQLIRNCDRA